MLQKCSLTIVCTELMDVYGEGKGVIMTKNGNELATVTGRSIAKHTSQEK